MDFEKAAAPMGPPKAPSAGGAGSPTLSGGAPTKPPTAHANANSGAFKAEAPMNKMLTPHSASAAAQGPGGAPPAPPAEKAVPKAPSHYDASLYQPPAGLSSGLDLAGDASKVRGGTPTLPGTGVTPRPAAPSGLRSPAMHQNISGFLGTAKKAETSMGKMCKACGKSHGFGKCA
jgi:hypothetical protein